MKNSLLALFVMLLTAAVYPAHAAENSILTTMRSGSIDFSKTKSLEAGMMISSLNSGTAFAQVAFNHEFGDWFTGGVRGLLPLDVTRSTKTYAAQFYGRFPLINTEDVAFIEPTVSQGFFSGRDSSSPFWMLGASYGYFRRLGGDYTAGFNFGADYSPSRVAGDKLVAGSSSIYTHITVTGGFYW